MLGAALGGERAALLMQSSGVGNCVNTFSILKNCAVPCVLLVTMRGEAADFNPWQVPMGEITEPVLTLCGFQTYRIDDEGDSRLDRRLRLPHGLQRRQLPGRDPVVAAHGRPQQEGPLTVDRRALVAKLLENRGACWSSPASARRPMTSPPAATMRATSTSGAGLAARRRSGSGLALARPDRRVAVITGDGDVLMALGSLATIGVKQPNNLSIVCLDNGHYSATGMQPSATSAGVDLAAAAAACRLRVELVADLSRAGELRTLLHSGEGPFFIHAKVDADDQKRIIPSRDGPGDQVSLHAGNGPAELKLGRALSGTKAVDRPNRK